MKVNQRNFQIKQIWGSITDERTFSEQYSKNGCEVHCLRDLLATSGQKVGFLALPPYCKKVLS